jgi:hypothetical protein
MWWGMHGKIKEGKKKASLAKISSREMYAAYRSRTIFSERNRSKKQSKNAPQRFLSTSIKAIYS